MKIVKFSGSAKYRINEQFQNLTIFCNFNHFSNRKFLEMRQFRKLSG